MRDLAGARAMYVKALLLMAVALLAGTLLFLESPSLRTVALLSLLAWASARVYYFLFYVIERYIDSSFRFSGVFSAVRHLWKARRG